MRMINKVTDRQLKGKNKLTLIALLKRSKIQEVHKLDF